jgi:tetratricopeptide (TPR) repeat protein
LVRRLAAEESAPVQPLPTVADVLDEGLTDLFDGEDQEDESIEPADLEEADMVSDLGFLEEELFGQIEDESEDSPQPLPEIETLEEVDESDVDLSELEDDLFDLVDDEVVASSVPEPDESDQDDIEADLGFLEDELLNLEPGDEEDLDADFAEFVDFDADSDIETKILSDEALDLVNDDDTETEAEPEPLAATKIMAPIDDEPDSEEVIAPGDGFTEELADLDDAMAWLDNMAVEDSKLDELPLDEADTVPDPVEEEDTFADVVEGAGLTAADDSSAVEEAITDVPEELDDAMAWLETLAAKQGAPIEELPSLQEDDQQITEPELSAVLEDVLEIDDSAIAEPIESDSGDEPAGDELLETIPDVPEDLDDAMAWLEELAAKQGAPIEELPSLSESMESATEPLPVDDEMPETVPEMVEESGGAVDPGLLAELDWLDEAVGDADGDIEETAVSDTSDTDLLAALDALEQLALQTEPEPVTETIAEQPEEDALTADIFDMPDDPDEALAWLEEMSDEADGEETAVPETVVIEPDPIVEEPAPDPVAADSDDLAALDIFDMPDDPDEALAWLEEVADDTPPPVTEPPTTMVIDPEEIQELASEPAGEVETEDVSEPIAKIEPEIVAEEAPEPAEELGGELDDILGAFDMPDDPDAALAWLEEVSDDDGPAVVEEPETAVIDEPAPTEETPTAMTVEEPVEEAVDLSEEFLSDVPEDPDEAMAWLEQLAARQGADLDELPTVTEQPDDEDIETPDWIAAAAEQAEEAAESQTDEAIPELTEETPEPQGERTSEIDAELQELDDILPDEELEEIHGDEDVDESLPSWLDAESDNVAIPSQTDWLSDLPEPDVTGWLAAEAEVSGTSSEGTGPLPETGPLFESVVSDTSPLETGPISEPADELPIISETDELSSSMFQIDEDQLDSARSSLSEGNPEDAVSIYRDLVSKGGGLMMLINELESVSTDYPEQREVRRLLGDAYMRNGQLQKALSTYREALDQL